MQSVYIVMPHYIMSERLLQLSIGALDSFKKTAPDVKIISVVNGKPPIEHAEREISSRSYMTLLLEENVGFAKGCNRGFNIALQFEEEDFYLGCANNDIEVYDGWDRAMIEPFEKWDNVGITGLISTKDRELAPTYQVKKITQGGRLKDWMQSGGLWLSKASVLRKIGLFDEQFELGGLEDVDLFLRLRDTFGYRIVMSGFSCFWHEEGATRWSDDVRPGYGKEAKAVENVNLDKFTKKWGFNYWTRNVWKEEELLNAT